MATASSPMRSLERAIEVLEVLDSARGSLRLTEIAKRADLPVATTQRILAVLAAHDRVEHDASGYRPGIALTYGAHAFSTTNPLIRAARPILIELAAVTGLTVTLFREHRDLRVVMSRAGNTRNFGYDLVVGSRLPLYLGAGKALLAQWEDDEVRELLKHAPVGPGAPAVPEADALLEDLAQIRERGFSISREERQPGVASVAAAVPLEYGVRAAIQATGTVDDFPDEQHVAALGRQVQQATLGVGLGLPHPAGD